MEIESIDKKVRKKAIREAANQLEAWRKACPLGIMEYFDAVGVSKEIGSNGRMWGNTVMANFCKAVLDFHAECIGQKAVDEFLARVETTATELNELRERQDDNG